MHDSTKNVRELYSTYSAKLSPEDISKKPPEVLKTSPYGPIYNAKRSIRRGTSFGRNELFWNHFYFSWLQLYVRHCTAKISQKPDTSYFGPIMVQDTSIKIGPLRDALRTLCASWVLKNHLKQMNPLILMKHTILSGFIAS